MKPGFAMAFAVVMVSSVSAEDEVRVLAANKTSTMEREINQAADAGFRFADVMGGDTSFGGSEVTVVMVRSKDAKPAYQYRLLATNKTSTMQKELQDAGDAGYEYKGQTVFNSAFGGNEVVVLLERDRTNDKPQRFEYRLLATKRTSTLQKELAEAMKAGFEFVGLTVAETAVSGDELVSILRRATK